jgi:hypothetical protein
MKSGKFAPHILVIGSIWERFPENQFNFGSEAVSSGCPASDHSDIKPVSGALHNAV